MKRALLSSVVILGLCFPIWAFEAILLDAPTCSAKWITESEHIAYDTPMEGRIEVTVPTTVTPQLPALQARFRGFEVVEEYADPPLSAGNQTLYTWHFRLTPAAGGPWGLRPFTIRLQNRQTGESAFATQMLTFPEPPPLPPAANAPEVTLTPIWIAPRWQTIAAWSVGGLLALVGLWLLFPKLKRGAQAIRERRLSPEERANLELNRLLAQNLVAQGEFKRFYFGLTGVVRRYFERSHHVRATRQTTPEFLALLMQDSAFPAERRETVAAFLSAADKIKFAGIRATPEEATAAITSVRKLIAPPPPAQDEAR